MEIHPPQYPLSRKAFVSALVTGHGRALVNAERFNVAQFREEILHAATTCLVYDTQIDGQREGWLARLCEFAGLVDTIIGLQPDESSRNRELRADLLKEFHLADHMREASLLKTETEPMVLVNVLWCLYAQRLENVEPALLEFVFHENDDVRDYAGRLFAHMGPSFSNRMNRFKTPVSRYSFMNSCLVCFVAVMPWNFSLNGEITPRDC